MKPFRGHLKGAARRANDFSAHKRRRIRSQLRRLYGAQCIKCSAKNVPLRLDHVLPFSMGGAYHLSNLQLLCEPCDVEKGPRHIDYRPFHPNSRPVPR